MAATLKDNAVQLLNKRYLDNGETINHLWQRVSGGNDDYRRLMEELLFLPNSPTLFNAGTNNGCTLSACFVFNIGDYMLMDHGEVMGDSIVRTREKAIAVAKAGGGVGYYLGNLRRKLAPIKSIQRVACGPVTVLFDLNGIQRLVTQGGKRELAQMAVLPVVHDDIREFIHCKDEDPQALSSFNISVSWDQTSADRAVLAPHANRHEKELWDEQVDSAWKHGCPGMYFVDTVNATNPNPRLGLMLAPNPCGETPNRNDEPCNLGSLCLWRFVDLKTREVQWGKLEDTIRVATRFLDDILDRNVFPHPSIDAAARLTRKLGLGVMGWADMLALLGIHYDTQEAVDLGRKVMAFISQITLEESVKLATEKGPYTGFDEHRTVGERRRNETNTSIAPTGSIANIVGASCSIEPHFAEEAQRTTAEGMRWIERIPVEEHLDGFKPKMAHDIHWKWHVEHQAAFQVYTDLGVSKTINLPNTATKQDVSDAYHTMYVKKCKGGTIFRDGCRNEQVLIKTKSTSVYSRGVDLPNGNGYTNNNGVVKRCLPGECKTIRRKFNIGAVKGYLHVGLYDDGVPGEIFLRVSRQGSTVSGMLDAWAMTFSNALQHGTKLEDLVRLHHGHRCEPNGMTGVKEIPVCTSIHDFVVRWMELKFIKPETKTTQGSNGQLCPDCGSMTTSQANCLVCTTDGCGWSRCG